MKLLERPDLDSNQGLTAEKRARSRLEAVRTRRTSPVRSVGPGLSVPLCDQVRDKVASRARTVLSVLPPVSARSPNAHIFRSSVRRARGGSAEGIRRRRWLIDALTRQLGLRRARPAAVAQRLGGGAHAFRSYDRNDLRASLAARCSSCRRTHASSGGSRPQRGSARRSAWRRDGPRCLSSGLSAEMPRTFRWLREALEFTAAPVPVALAADAMRLCGATLELSQRILDVKSRPKADLPRALPRHER